MGLKDLFKKKAQESGNQNEENGGIFAPVTGKLLPITEVPDPVFSQKMMGDGFAIDPTDGKIYSPVYGKVVSVFPTKHAVSLLTNDGLEVLVHVGMDTVTLKGEGFTAHVSEGSIVTPNDLMISVNLEAIRSKVPSLITPIIFTNLQEKAVKLLKSGIVNHGEENVAEIK